MGEKWREEDGKEEGGGSFDLLGGTGPGLIVGNVWAHYIGRGGDADAVLACVAGGGGCIVHYEGAVGLESALARDE